MSAAAVSAPQTPDVIGTGSLRRGKYQGPTQVFDVPEWGPFWQSLEPLVDEIRRSTLLPQEYHRPLITSPALKIAKAAFILAASPQHHDQDAGGLVRHTLRVAADVVKRAPAIAKQTGCELTKADHAALIALAFLHDMGRLFEMRVSSETDPTQRWEPYDLNLHEWCVSNKVRRLQVTWRTDRSLTGAKSSEQLGALLFAHFIPTSLISFLGQGMSVAMAHAFSRSVGKPAFDYYRLIKASDVACARHARGREPLAEYVMRELEEAIITVVPNRSDGGVFVSPSHTVLAIPDTVPNRLAAWNRLLVATVGVHPEMAAGGDLLNRMLDVRPNAFVWWTPSGEKAHPCAQHVMILEDGNRMLVLVIDNRMLWTGGVPPAGFGTPPRAWFGRLGAPMQASADPVELGFVACVPGLAARAVVAPAPAPLAAVPAVAVPSPPPPPVEQAPPAPPPVGLAARKGAAPVSAEAMAQGKVPPRATGEKTEIVRPLQDLCAGEGALNNNERIVALLQLFVTVARGQPTAEEIPLLEEIGDPFTADLDVWRKRVSEILVLLLRRFHPTTVNF